MPTNTRWKPLQAGDVTGFDKEATALVLDATEHGWIGRLSSKGHAILRAPDGETTMSVARETLRARAGRNARADLDRWKRSQRNEVRENTTPKPNGSGSFACLDCGKQFEERAHLTAHRKKRHTQENVMAGTSTRTKVIGKGNTKGVNPLAHEYGEFPCPECGKVYKLPGYLRGHRAVQHGVDAKHVCEECGKPNVGPKRLQTHIEKHHPWKLRERQASAETSAPVKSYEFECRECGKGFSNERGYESHLLTHATPVRERIECSYEGCALTFADWTELGRHLAAHKIVNEQVEPTPVAAAPVETKPAPVAEAPGPKPMEPVAMSGVSGTHKCEEDGCDASFPNRYALRAHSISHAPVMACEVCGNAYTFLTAHQAQAHSTAELAEAMHRMRLWCEEQSLEADDAQATLALAREALGM